MKLRMGDFTEKKSTVRLCEQLKLFLITEPKWCLRVPGCTYILGVLNSTVLRDHSHLPLPLSLMMRWTSHGQLPRRGLHCLTCLGWYNKSPDAGSADSEPARKHRCTIWGTLTPTQENNFPRIHPPAQGLLYQFFRATEQVISEFFLFLRQSAEQLGLKCVLLLIEQFKIQHPLWGDLNF